MAYDTTTVVGPCIGEINRITTTVSKLFSDRDNEVLDQLSALHSKFAGTAFELPPPPLHDTKRVFDEHMQAVFKLLQVATAASYPQRPAGIRAKSRALDFGRRANFNGAAQVQHHPATAHTSVPLLQGANAQSSKIRRRQDSKVVEIIQHFVSTLVSDVNSSADRWLDAAVPHLPP